jgi:dTDP-4-dehydrorhamnose 3,5-epimerase-like enzyme
MGAARPGRAGPEGVGEPTVVRLAAHPGPRGTLLVAEAGAVLSFAAARYFVVHGVPPGSHRGQHAQRRGEELLTCLVGACTVDLRWAGGRAAYRLDDPSLALHLPARVWVDCSAFTAEAVLLVLCSLPYDPADQITDEEAFRAELGRAR